MKTDGKNFFGGILTKWQTAAIFGFSESVNTSENLADRNSVSNIKL